MNYLISASTDIGLVKSVNQDSLTVKSFETPIGKMVFCALCDGMGGLASGELASATVINELSQWLFQSGAALFQNTIDGAVLEKEWTELMNRVNSKIQNYGESMGIKLGTTATVMLLTDENYFILNIGDSRAYEISNRLIQLTEDHTVVHREIQMGRLTEAEARTDPRRSILLQCIGASVNIMPDMFYGKTKKDAVYILCSDGFRHEITEEEMYSIFHPERLLSTQLMKQSEEYLINLNKQRQERDNISVLTIRTY